MLIRSAADADNGAIWRVLEPTIRAGETLMLPSEMDQPAALSYWRQPSHLAFVAEDGAEIVGTYYLRANQQGHGSHVANCGYATATRATGRGVARAMCLHSLEEARARGFTAMQFNCVVASNERAVGLWRSCGFEIVGRVPDTFRHPRLGPVDTLVMYRRL
ncbi:MAG: N-acetyltransferase family protein [Geminicoccaceae bacterium]